MKNSKLKVGDTILVEWRDAVSPEEDGWIIESKPLAPVRIVSLGVLVEVGEDYYTWAANVAENGARLGAMCVPKGAVVRVRRV